MKNKLLKITSFVLAMVLVLGVLVYAEDSSTITMTDVSSDGMIKSDASVGSDAVIASDATAQPVLTIDSDLVTKSGEMVDVYFNLDVGDVSVKNFAIMLIGYDKDAFRLVKGNILDIGSPILAAWDDEKHNMAAAYAGEENDINGNILKISFKVKGDAKSGVYPISCVMEINGDEIDVKDGSIIVEENPNAVIDPKDSPDYVIDSVSRKADSIVMCVGESVAYVYAKKVSIDSANKLVVPYIKNDRTLVPLRFISESIGAEVLWEDGWDYCLIKKGDKEIKITFGSAEFEVNGEKFTYEAPIETVYDRTMVPVRFISEHLGYGVYWNEINEAVVISPLDNPWFEKREAEKTALAEVLVSIKGILP